MDTKTSTIMAKKIQLEALKKRLLKKQKKLERYRQVKSEVKAKVDKHNAAIGPPEEASIERTRCVSFSLGRCLSPCHQDSRNGDTSGDYEDDSNINLSLDVLKAAMTQQKTTDMEFSLPDHEFESLKLRNIFKQLVDMSRDEKEFELPSHWFKPVFELDVTLHNEVLQDCLDTCLEKTNPKSQHSSLEDLQCISLLDQQEEITSAQLATCTDCTQYIVLCTNHTVHLYSITHNRVGSQHKQSLPRLSSWDLETLRCNGEITVSHKPQLMPCSNKKQCYVLIESTYYEPIVKHQLTLLVHRAGETNSQTVLCSVDCDLLLCTIADKDSVCVCVHHNCTAQLRLYTCTDDQMPKNNGTSTGVLNMNDLSRKEYSGSTDYRLMARLQGRIHGMVRLDGICGAVVTVTANKIAIWNCTEHLCVCEVDFELGSIESVKFAVAEKGMVFLCLELLRDKHLASVYILNPSTKRIVSIAGIESPKDIVFHLSNIHVFNGYYLSYSDNQLVLWSMYSGKIVKTYHTPYAVLAIDTSHVPNDRDDSTSTIYVASTDCKRVQVARYQQV